MLDLTSRAPELMSHIFLESLHFLVIYTGDFCWKCHTWKVHIEPHLSWKRAAILDLWACIYSPSTHPPPHPPPTPHPVSRWLMSPQTLHILHVTLHTKGQRRQENHTFEFRERFSQWSQFPGGRNKIIADTTYCQCYIFLQFNKTKPKYDRIRHRDFWLCPRRKENQPLL